MSASDAATPDPSARPSGRRVLRSRQEVRDRRRRVVTYGLLVGSAILVVDALVGDGGYLAKLRGHKEQAALEAQLKEIRDENYRLADLVDRLRQDPNTIETAARKDLHLLAPGEIMIEVRGEPPPAAGRSRD